MRIPSSVMAWVWAGALAVAALFAGAAGLRAQMQQGGTMAGMQMGGAAAATGMPGNPISADALSSYNSIKDILTRSAAKMPDDKYSFRTVPEVRTYAEMIDHIADVQMTLCSLVKGEQKKADTAGKTSKADVSAVLKASFDYCDPVYAGMTDAAGVQSVRMFGRNTEQAGRAFLQRHPR